ncbi:hypothetical protein DPX16_19098, partial [Anabarilius grahami]
VSPLIPPFLYSDTPPYCDIPNTDSPSGILLLSSWDVPPPTCLHGIPWDEGMEEEEGGGLMNNFSLDEHQDDSVGRVAGARDSRRSSRTHSYTQLSSHAQPVGLSVAVRCPRGGERKRQVSDSVLISFFAELPP